MNIKLLFCPNAITNLLLLYHVIFFFSYQDKDFFDKCRQEYLQKREDFQKDYVQSGKVKDLKKKDSVIL